MKSPIFKKCTLIWVVSTGLIGFQAGGVIQADQRPALQENLAKPPSFASTEAKAGPSTETKTETKGDSADPSFPVPDFPQTPPVQVPASNAQEEAVFVDNGKPELVETVGEKWTQGEGYLEGSGPGNLLRTVRAIGSGDFHLKIELTLFDVERSGASVVLGEGNHFGFSGGNHRMFVEGPIFPGGQQILVPTEDSVPEGRRFRLEIIRKEKKVDFLIDGRSVYSMHSDGGPIGQVALRPWRSRMRVHQFIATGRILDIPRVSAKPEPSASPTRMPGEAEHEKSKPSAQEPSAKDPPAEHSEQSPLSSKQPSK